PGRTRHIEPSKVGVAEVDRPFKDHIVEKGVASDFHAVEDGCLLKLCPIRFEIVGDVCVAEHHRPFEYRTEEKGVASDFHAAKAGGVFLVLKSCPIRFEITSDVCRAEVHRPLEHCLPEKDG